MDRQISLTDQIQDTIAPMADQFDAFQKEVEEDLQREKFSRFLQDNQTYLLGAAAALVLAVGGWKLIEHRRQSAAEAQSARYVAAAKLLADNKGDDAQKALTALAGSQDAYGALARLRLAAVDASAGKTAEAAAHYEAVAKQSGVDPLLSGFARLQTAMLKVDTADWTEMQNRLNDLTTDSNPWRHSARELLGMSAFKAGKIDEARGQFEKLLSDRATPPNISERVTMMMAMLTQADLAKAAGSATVQPSAPVPVTPVPGTPVPGTPVPGTLAPLKPAEKPGKKN